MTGVDISAWRENREKGWYKDIGYAIQTVIQSHRYDYKAKGEKPDDPGWHECACGQWAGYWSSFEPHVADCVRALIAGWAAPKVSEARKREIQDEIEEHGAEYVAQWGADEAAVTAAEAVLYGKEKK